MFCGWGGMGWGSLPSYEGSGLKSDIVYSQTQPEGLPSHEGSGLKL